MLAYEDVFTSFFSILMLTSISSRRHICNALENIVDHLNLYGDMNQKIRHPLYNLHFSKEEDNWQISVASVAKELQKRSFFCRFDLSTLHEFIPRMKVTQYPANSILFTKGRVYVITAGFVTVRNHGVKLQEGELMAKLQAGDVLGYP